MQEPESFRPAIFTCVDKGSEMKEKEHLPIYGIGPLFGAVAIALTVAAVLLRNLPSLSTGKIESVRTLLLILGIAFIIGGIALWIYAVPISKIDDGILENRLVTTGAYALVRNPIYSAIMIACTGVIIILGNAYFFVLPFVFWIFMTVLLKPTEEKWLREMFGKEYEDYCKRVNRCWPWFPKKGMKR